jgi:hypothetical protein
VVKIDSWMGIELHMRRHDDKKNPRVVVSVRRAS